MTKKEFLKELRRELQPLSFDEQEDAISYYEEYIQESDNEEEAIKLLGSPKDIAKGLRTESAITKPPKTIKEGASKLWILIVAIFAAPIALPLLITIIGLIFGLAFGFFGIVLGFFVISIRVLGSGLFTLISSFLMMHLGFTTFLFYFGTGLAFTGLGILATLSMIFIIKKLLSIVITILRSIIRKVTKEQHKEAM